MKKSLFHFVTLYLLAWITISSAQVPTLNAEQTVNPATGEMGFSLPLGAVRGVGGLHYPISLNYKAGIRTRQPASDVGLGFSCSPGGIVRYTVGIPDDFSDPSKYSYTSGDCFDEQCELAAWKKFFLGLISAGISIVTTWVTGALGMPFIAEAVIAGLSAIVMAGVTDYYSPSESDFYTQGPQVLSYEPEHSSKLGLFHGGGDDAADMYFVNTPYFSGQLVWVGGEDGYFSARTTAGSTDKSAATVHIDYDKDSYVFVITLPNGNRLFFEKADKYATRAFGIWARSNDDGDVCCKADTWELKEAVPVQWHLTKVLASDFVDGNGDLDPTNSRGKNQGGWVVFNYVVRRSNMWRKKYESSLGLAEATGPHTQRSMIYGAYKSDYDRTTICEWSGVETELEYAAVERNGNMHNRFWLNADEESLSMSEYAISEIAISRMHGGGVRKISLNHSKTLRPGSDKHPDVETIEESKALTLDNVQICAYDASYDALNEVSVEFEYGESNPSARGVARAREHLDSRRYPPADLWGYYYPNTSYDFNVNGSYDKAHNNGKPYAAAWSLTGVSLPGGQKLEWTYESNRYDRANGWGLGSTQYGGGIRVRDVTALDQAAGGKSRKIVYYYNSVSSYVSSDFDDETNTSGHATVIPYAYHREASADDRPRGAKGGPYTEAKVLYEKVRIVPEVVETPTTNAPYGYTCMEFTTCNEYPNAGYYGEINKGYARGLLKSSEQRNKDGELIASVHNVYNIDEEPATGPFERSTNFAASAGWAALSCQLPLGIVHISEVTTVRDNVTTTKSYKTGCESGQAADCRKYTRLDVTTYERIWGSFSQDEAQATFATTDKFGMIHDDVVMAYNVGSYLDLRIYIDIGSNSESVRTVTYDNWDNNERVVAVTVAKVNYNENVDIVVVSTKQGTTKAYTFLDAAGSFPAELPEPEIIGQLNRDYNIVSGDIGQIDGVRGLDLVMYEGSYVTTGLPQERNLYLIRNFLEPYRSNIHTGAVTLLGRGVPADHVTLFDKDGDGLENDIQITGPYYYPTGMGVMNHYLMQNIGYDGSNMTLTNTSVSETPGYLGTLGKDDEPLTRYIGKRYAGTNGDAMYGLILANAGDKTRLRMIREGKREFQRDYDGRPNMVTTTSADIQTTQMTVPAFCRYPALATEDHNLTANCEVVTSAGSAVSADKVVQANATTWNAPPRNEPAPEQEIGTYYPLNYGPLELISHDELTDPEPRNFDTGVRVICGQVLLTWWGLPKGAWAQNDVYLVKNSAVSLGEPHTKAASLRATSFSRLGQQVEVEANTKYFWKVVAKGTDGRTVNGPVWNFTTGDELVEDKPNCAQNGWLHLITPNEDMTVNPGDVIPIRWVGDVSDCIGTWITPGWSEATCGEISTGDWQAEWGLILYTVPESGAGESFKVKLQRDGEPISDEMAGTITVRESGKEKKYRPVAEYSYNVPMDATGLPTQEYSHFDFENPDQNGGEGWQYQGQVLKYNRHGEANELVNAVGTGTLSVYGFENAFPSGSIANANFEEAGIYTGDYDNKAAIAYSDTYTPVGLDRENGWEYGLTGEVTTSNAALVQIAEDKELFSTKCIKVTDAYGPTRNFKIDPNVDYIMSAWVRVQALDKERTKERFIMGGDFRKSEESEPEFPFLLPTRPAGGGSTDKFRNLGVSKSIDAPIKADDEKWQYVEMRIPARDVLNGEDGWYARVFFGTPPNSGAGIDGGTVYLQDLRFYPSDAIATTQYYDKTQQKAAVSLDANGKPGRKVTYDGFGRPVKWEKADLDGNSFRKWITLRGKEYQFAGLSEIYTNHFESSDPLFFVRSDADCPSCVTSNGEPDGKEGACASLRFTANSSYKTANRFALEIPAAAELTERTVFVTGYFKAEAGKMIRMSVSTNLGDLPYGFTPIERYTATGDWQQFWYVGSLEDFHEFDGAELLVQGYYPEAFTLYVDEIKISVL